MSYAQYIEIRGAVAHRPAKYEDLLLHPIGAEKDEKSCYIDWEFDHSAMQRFYVGGFRWFMRATGIDDLSRINSYSEAGVDLVDEQTNWYEMPFSGDRWENCSLNQFRAAKNRKPMYFQKAALVIAACEAALIDRLSSGRGVRRPTTIADIYTNMSIIPAVWNINDFDRAYLKNLQDADKAALDRITTAVGQSSKTFLDHLASGHCVTLGTAYGVKDFIDGNLEVSCGNVRSRPGVRGGTLNATDFEEVDVG